MGDFKSFKEASKTDFGTRNNEALSYDQIQLGALLRIADAIETMTKNIIQLEHSRDHYKKSCHNLGNRLEASENSRRSLKGHITRLKNKVQQLENQS